jgi:enoyl-[acyl-carrier protein] reductase II
MVSALESPVHDNWKKAILDAAETDTIFLNRRHGPGLRALRTERSERLEESPDNVMGEFGTAMDLYFGGDMEASLALSGQVCGRIDEIRPVAEIIGTCVEEFFATIERLADRYLAGSPTVAGA